MLGNWHLIFGGRGILSTAKLPNWREQGTKATAKKHTRQLLTALSRATEDADWSSLRPVLDGEEWRYLISSRGEHFVDFAQYATDISPYGLAVRDQQRAEKLKERLLSEGQVMPWIELLTRIRRQPGQQPANVAPGEVPRYYQVSTSLSSRDRIYLGLYDNNHGDLLADISKGVLKAKQAALKAGLIDPQPPAVCNTEAFKKMSDPDQAKILRKFYRLARRETKCIFLEQELGAAGKRMAQNWRASHEERGQQSTREQA